MPDPEQPHFNLDKAWHDLVEGKGFARDSAISIIIEKIRELEKRLDHSNIDPETKALVDSFFPKG